MKKVFTIAFALLMLLPIVAVAQSPSAPAPLTPTVDEMAQLKDMQKDAIIKNQQVTIVRMQYQNAVQESQTALVQLQGAAEQIAKKHGWDATFDVDTLTFTPQKTVKK